MIDRIVEIGGRGFFIHTHPDRSLLLWTSEEDPDSPLPSNVREFGPLELLRLARSARRGEVGLIVVYPTRHSPWHWRPLRSLMHRPFGPWRRFFRLFGPQSLRLIPDSVPVFAVDEDDMRTISRHNLFFLDRCRYYFKREIPIDRWQVFQKTAHPAMPSTRFRKREQNRRRIAKLRPWSIGLETDLPVLPPTEFPEKTIDLFVCLSSPNSSTVRIEGLKELKALATRRERIEIAEQRVPREQYLRTMSRSWLTWSPEGFGWDCIRHYEAAACHSVPVINQPTIVRRYPFLHGKQAIYYDADVPGSLTQVIEVALENTALLKDMALAAREHVARHHLTPWGRSAELLRYARGLEEPPGGLAF